jgi:hypothetical protein
MIDSAIHRRLPSEIPLFVTSLEQLNAFEADGGITPERVATLPLSWRTLDSAPYAGFRK